MPVDSLNTPAGEGAPEGESFQTEERYEVLHAFGFRLPGARLSTFVTNDNLAEVLPYMPPALVEKYLRMEFLSKYNAIVEDEAGAEGAPADDNQP